MRRCTAKALRRVAVAAPLALIASTSLAAMTSTLPPVRPGFWIGRMVMHVNIAGHPPDTNNTPTVGYNCLNAASMAVEMKALTGRRKGCASHLVGSGSHYTISASCHVQGGTVISNGTFTIVGTTEIRIVVNAVSHLSNLHMTSDITSDIKWVGACPAGVVPGDHGIVRNGAFHKLGNWLTK